MLACNNDMHMARSFQLQKPSEYEDAKQFRSYGPRSSPIEPIGSVFERTTSPVSRFCKTKHASPGGNAHHTDLELMKERFAKLLLGEDMSGGGKGVSSALALSNAITNLAASIFGEQKKLEPMNPDTKLRWKTEINWLLSVTDHIVEFVPSKQKTKDGTNMEIMVTQQRRDLLMNIPALRKLDAMLIECLENFKDQNEFWYVSNDADEAEKRNDKWWLPTVKVPPNGLSDVSRKWLLFQKESVNQVLKAAMSINAQTLAEMEIPDNYLETLPKNGRSSLGDSMYKSITDEYFNPLDLLASIDLSTEYKVLDLKNKIEASIVIWKRKMNHKERSSWGTAISFERRELFEERLETILLLLKHRFPGIAQSSLDISKIQYNRDVGHSTLESYSRVLESLASTIMSRVEDVLKANSVVNNYSTVLPEEYSDIVRPNDGGTPKLKTLSDFMGRTTDKGQRVMKKSNLVDDNQDDFKDEDEKLSKPAKIKRLSYIDKLEALGALRSPSRPGFDSVNVEDGNTTKGGNLSGLLI